VSDFCCCDELEMVRARLATAEALADALATALGALVKVAEGWNIHNDEACGRYAGECDESYADCTQHGESDGLDHCPSCECGVSELQLAVTRGRAALAAGPEACGAASRTLGSCDLPRGHAGAHASAGDAFAAPEEGR